MASPSHPDLRSAERQFTRSVLAGLCLLGLVAVAGPLLSYRGDVHEMRDQFRARLEREGRVYAEALGLHMQLLKSELARVATGVGPELQEGRAIEDMQDLTAPDIGLFRQGIMLLDASGAVRWSDPLARMPEDVVRGRAWFQRVLQQQVPVVDALDPGSSTFVVAVPVVRERRTLGMLAGLIDAGSGLPGSRPLSSHLKLVVLNHEGDIFLPAQPPSWATTPGFAATRAALARLTPALVVLDRRLPDGDGLTFLPELKAHAPGAVVVMVTAHGDIASAVDAVRAGAADYVAKPVELADLVLRARRALDTGRLKDRLAAAEAELSGRRRLVPPASAAMRRVLAALERIASSPRSAVMLLGETGTGKEMLARHLHALSARDEDTPFVHVNCAALPEQTVESELFGHEKGAFTDARTARRGLVEVAHGGTLFLDEVGELPLGLQAKLLTFLDSGRFRRLGGTTEHSSSARIVAATHRDLPGLMTRGEFREDLWFRLSVFRIDIPPLRERPEDLLPLAEGILADLRRELGRRDASLGPRARARLAAYAFPGNVRELRNLLERALVMEPGPELELDVLEAAQPVTARAPAALPADPTAFVLSGPPRALEDVERAYTRWVLEQLGGRRMEAAKVLGLSYPTFLKRLGEGT